MRQGIGGPGGAGRGGREGDRARAAGAIGDGQPGALVVDHGEVERVDGGTVDQERRTARVGGGNGLGRTGRPDVLRGEGQRRRRERDGGPGRRRRRGWRGRRRRRGWRG